MITYLSAKQNCYRVFKFKRCLQLSITYCVYSKAVLVLVHVLCVYSQAVLLYIVYGSCIYSSVVFGTYILAVLTVEQ